MYTKDKKNNIVKDYEYTMKKEKKKNYGCFYTPDYIIDYIIKNTFNNLDVVKNPFLKIIDPSCGVGYFLIKVFQFLIDEFSKNIYSLSEEYKEKEYTINNYKKLKGKDYWTIENLEYHIITHCIYGADIDDSAVELCKHNIMVKCINKNLNLNVVCCDSLIKWEEKEHADKEKLHEFWKNKYDYVVGNPPWVSLNRKQKQNKDEALVFYYSKKYKGNKYLPNLYEYFIKRSLEVLKLEGRLGFVLPDRFAKNLQYKSFRKEIILNYNIKNLAFEIEFPNINTDVMIFVMEMSYTKNNKINLSVYKIRDYYIYQKNYLENNNYEFLYDNNSFNKTINEKMKQGSTPLGEVSTTFTGFIGNSKEITKGKVYKEQTCILKGENISNFRVLNNCYYEFNESNIKGGTKNIKKLTYYPKIVVRKTGSKIIAALDKEGIIIEQSLYGVIDLDEKFSCKYILAILNSKLMQWYYLNFLVTNLKSTPQIKKYSLDQIPIKFCERERQLKIEKLVDEIKENYDLYEKIKEKIDKEIFLIYDIEEKYRNKVFSQL